MAGTVQRPQLRRQRVTDPAAHRAVRDTQQAVDDLATHPRLSGRYVGPVTLTVGGTTKIAHGLGRALRGWQVVDNTTATTTAGTVYRSKGTTTSKPDPTKELWLCAVGYSANPSVLLWVE